MEVHPIEMQLKRITNDPSVEHRHRRIVLEAQRVIAQLSDELAEYHKIDEVLEKSERLQQVLAEELDKQS